MLAFVRMSTVYAQDVDFSLDVSGNIKNFTDPATHSYRFNRKDLLALGSKTIKTSTNSASLSPGKFGLSRIESEYPYNRGERLFKCC